MNTPAFKVTVENEHSVIRLTECEHGDALWNIKGTQCGGLVISRDDDHTHISLRVPTEMLRALLCELETQVSAMEEADLFCGFDTPKGRA